MQLRESYPDYRDMAIRPIRTNVAYRVAKQLVDRRQAKHGAIATSETWKAYGNWREERLRELLIIGFGADVANGKRVLDFGCGDGALSTVLMDFGADAVHGVDLSQACLDRFADRLKAYAGPRAPTFSLATSPKRIDKPSQHYDAIFCFDVLEHVMDYRENIAEWFRVLKPGGSVYIWWQPYWHPYGHHAHDWVPIPWIHVVLNDDEIGEVCARIVDWEGFKPSVWDRHPNGSKRNRFREPGAGGDDFLNKLTVREFERLCCEAGFEFARRDFRPFTLPQPFNAISAVLTKMPLLRDYFTSFVVYELRRPTGVRLQDDPHRRARPRSQLRN